MDWGILSRCLWEEPESSIHDLGMIGHWDDDFYSVWWGFEEVSMARVPASIPKLAVAYWLSHTLLLKGINVHLFQKKKRKKEKVI